MSRPLCGAVAEFGKKMLDCAGLEMLAIAWALPNME
jgi:hypothetical protein